jgi:hypothetical protein
VKAPATILFLLACVIGAAGVGSFPKEQGNGVWLLACAGFVMVVAIAIGRTRR